MTMVVFIPRLLTILHRDVEPKEFFRLGVQPAPVHPLVQWCGLEIRVAVEKNSQFSSP